MQLNSFTPVKGWKYKLLSSKQKRSLYSHFGNSDVRKSGILFAFMGLLALLVSAVPLQAQETLCWVSTNTAKANIVNATTEWTVNQAAGTVTIRTTFAKTFVDNTYGTNAVGWPNGHKFSDLTGSDKLTLSLKDGSNVEKMNLTLDYISANANAPSKYSTLGVSGGEGKVNKGAAADVVSVKTSISENLNTLGYVLITNSPATNANYAPNAVYPNWIYDVWYEVTVKLSAFGTAGFGSPAIQAVHASPSKTGVNEEPVTSTVCPKFDLALDKKVKAGQPSVFAPGDNVTFTIKVYNQGNTPASSIIITDYIPTGLTLNDPDWTAAASAKTRHTISSLAAGASATVDITFKVQTNVNGTIINRAEISSATGGTDEDSTPDAINGNQPGETGTQLKDNVINENGKAGGDEDDHDIAPIAVNNSTTRFDLALRKTLTPGQTSTIRPGDVVSFTIEVFNQGTVDATNVVITDYIPANVTLNDVDWTNLVGNKTTYTIPFLAAGASEEVEIIFTTDDAITPGTIVRNTAEISNAAGGTDIDSTPDATNGNQAGEAGAQIVNDAIDQNGKTGGDEDDHDYAVVTICDLPLGGSDLVIFPPSTSADLPDAQTGQSWALLSKPAGAAAAITSPAGIVSGMTVNGLYQFVLRGTTGCNDTVRISRAPSPSGEGEICWVSETKPTIVSAKMTWKEVGSNIVIRTTFARTFVDNTYGTNAIGWGTKGHKFKDLTGSDHLQLALFDGAGTKKLEFKIDYITQSSAAPVAPSGYKTLSVNGGDGKMIVGSAADVVGALTAMDVNFNQFGYKLETNSPLTDADYTPNPTYPNWIYDVWYEVTVKKSAFGTAGFGQPYITGIHASPSKTGNNTEIVIPGSCPVAFAEANDVCEGGTIILLASSAPSGSTFFWSGPNGFSSTEQSPVITDATTDDAGLYTLTTKLNQNFATDTITVHVFPKLNAPTATSNINQICAGDTLKLFGSSEAGVTYSWKGPNQFTSALQNPVIPNVTAAVNGNYILTVTRNGCTAADTVAVTLRNCCPTITVTDNGRDTLCSGYYGEAFSVNYTNLGSNTVKFVRFTTPQTGNSMYTGGTILQGSASGNGTAQWPVGQPGSQFPANNGTTAVNYYVYAILTNLPTDANCRPFAEKIYRVLPLPKFTTAPQPVCQGSSAFDVKVTIQSVGTFKITLARGVTSVGNGPIPQDVIKTQSGAAGNGAVTTLSVPIADTAGVFVIVQNEATGCAAVGNSGKPVVNKAPKWTLTGLPACSADKQTYSITFTVTGKNSTIKASRGILTGSNPYTVTGVPSGATLKLTDSLSAICKFDTLIIGPNCNCEPKAPEVIIPSGTVCSGDTFPTLKAIVIGLAQVEWFTVPTGGTPVFVGPNYKPAGIATASAYTYYVQMRVIDPGCLAAVSPRVPATINVTNCCPTITTTDDGKDTLCSGYYGEAFSVNYTNIGNNEIQFVMFSSPQTGSGMYTGGTILTGSASSNGIAQWPVGLPGSQFPANNGTAPVNYYVYAILKNLPANANCRPAAVKIYTVLPLPKFTAAAQPVCEGSTAFDVKVTIQSAGTFKITLARGVASVGNGPIPQDVIKTQSGVAGNGVTTTLSVPIADTVGVFVIVQNEATGCASVGNSGKPLVSKKPKWTLIGQPSCAANLQTYSVTFMVSGKNGIITANKGVLTGSNPYTVTGIPSGATLKLTDSLSAICKFDTLITGPNCNCTPVSPTILTPSFTICKGDTFPTIKATVIGLAVVEWFAQATGGTPIFTGLNYKPVGPASVNTTFYAQARSTDPQCPVAVSSPRVSSFINVQDCNIEIDLALKKTINKKEAKIGDILTYTLKVWNESANNATGVEVTDHIAATVQFQTGSFSTVRGSASITGNTITWNIGNIAANGDTVTLTYQVKATQEGVHFNTAQICKANEKDVDSTPCNDNDNEDDIDRECFTAPFKLCPGEGVQANVPANYSNVVWYKVGSTTPVAQGNTVLFSETGSYTFTTTNGVCPAEGCCPIIIEPGDNCCPEDLCIPFTIKKSKKAGKPL